METRNSDSTDENREVLRNENVTVEIHNNEVSFTDRTDYNMMSGYTKGKRGLEKVIELIKKQFNEDTKFRDITNTLSDNQINYHTYCGMD